MADITGDGRLRLFFVASIVNIALPTVAELNLGIRLDRIVAAGGYTGFRPSTADVPSKPLSGTFDTVRVGTISFPDNPMLRLKKQSGSDTIYDTLVYGVEGFLAERRSLPAGDAWAADQKVKIFPIVCGETAWLDHEDNTLERYEIPIKITDQPNLRATVAA